MKIQWIRRLSVAMAVLAVSSVVLAKHHDPSTLQTDPLGTASGNAPLDQADMGWRQPGIPGALQNQRHHHHGGMTTGGGTIAGGGSTQDNCLNGTPLPATAPRHRTGHHRAQPVTPVIPCPQPPSGGGVSSGTDTSGGVAGNTDPGSTIIGSNGPLVTSHPSHHIHPAPAPEPGTLVLLALGLSVLALLRQVGEKR